MQATAKARSRNNRRKVRRSRSTESARRLTLPAIMTQSFFISLLLMSAFPAVAEVSFDYDQAKPLDLKDTVSR